MRFVFLVPLPINYTFLLHAHSHVAMLGWAYLLIYVLLVHFFIPKEKQKNPIYNRLFWFTEFSVIGMMVSFPIQGYALFSIIFSTLHILSSYVFCWLVWRDGDRGKSGDQKLLLTALFFMFFSTLGVWCLGPAVKTLGKQSDLYQIAIQFFLHFQFNGWFLFAVLALFLKQFKEQIQHNVFKKFFVLLIIGTFLTLAFPISWYIKNEILVGINTLGVLLQAVAFFCFFRIVKSQRSIFKTLNKNAKIVYAMALCSLSLKIGIQLLVLMPDIALFSHQIRNFVIGFIHLTTLGIITGFLFGILIQNKFLREHSNVLNLGVKSFVLGYITTEILLFLQGGMYYFNGGLLSGYYIGIFLTSVLIVVGLMLILISLIIKKARVDY